MTRLSKAAQERMAAGPTLPHIIKIYLSDCLPHQEPAKESAI